MGKDGLRDPLGTAQVIASLVSELRDLGLTPSMSADLAVFAALRLELRKEVVSPFFDPAVNDTSGNRFFWMKLTGSDGIIGLQAFRIDTVDSCLAHWAPSYIIGLYMRRGEVLMPLHPTPPRGSISERINGRVVYHGEIWIDRNIRNRRISQIFCRLGMLLAFVRWNPDAMWGLGSQSMATHGHFNRMGYSYLERGFFRWQWVAEGIDPVEWIVVAERTGLEQLVEEMLTTPQQFRQA